MKNKNPKFKKMLYPLDEAANIAGLHISEILHAGSNRSIQLLVNVPPCPPLYVIEYVTGLNSDKEVVWTPHGMRIPNLLVLSPTQSHLLELAGEISESEFYLGYSYSSGNSHWTENIRMHLPSQSVECDRDGSEKRNFSLNTTLFKWRFRGMEMPRKDHTKLKLHQIT